MQGTRNAARWIVAGCATRLGLDRRHAIRRRLAGRWGIVLRYHRVIPADEPPSYYRMGIDEALFERQMDWLAARHRLVSLDEFLWWTRSRQTPPADLIVLTFDDGYRDNRTHAAPILARRGLPAIFYVAASCFTERMPFWPETLAQMIRTSASESVTAPLDGRETSLPLATEPDRARSCLRLITGLRKLPTARIAEAIDLLASRLGSDPARAREATPPVMDAADVRALAAMGFLIGSHSVTHPFLPSEPAATQKAEIEDSRRLLEEATGAPVLDFCYPGGGYDATTVRLVREAGYRSATTTDPGIAGWQADAWRLPRLGVGQALATGPSGRFSPSMMQVEMSGLMDRLLRR